MRRFFYGWMVLAAAFVTTMSIGTLFTLGVFLEPIEDSNNPEGAGGATASTEPGDGG